MTSAASAPIDRRVRPLRWLLLPLVAALLAACATPQRPAFSEPQLAAADIAGIPDARHWADDPDLAAELVPPAPAPGTPVIELVLSGGADRGAYGAGFLNGWSESGKRPTFTIVTGVSTGALIAPFAFLGSDYDADLEAAYTGVGPHDIYSPRFLLAIPFSVSAATLDPLRRLLARHVTDAVIDRVAEEDRKGRRLYVVTTEIDAARGVVWDMGAIAASDAPGRYDLFREVMLASSSVPALFPPVAIDSRSHGRTIREWHVDGGSTGALLALPLTAAAGDDRRIFVLVNEKLGADFDFVDGHVVDIAKRAFEMSVRSDLRARAEAAERDARENGSRFHLTFIGRDFDDDGHEYFAKDYMRALFAYGRERGRRDAWLDAVPRGHREKPPPAGPDGN